MKQKPNLIKNAPLFFSLLLAFLTPWRVDACSRITYTSLDNTVVTGRSMDWMQDIQTDLWAFPAGIKRVGNNDDPNAVTWTSKYGSIIASGYNIATTDGINTEGLNANLLYLSTADYGKPQSNRKDISFLCWAQYVLDNYATVDDAVRDFGQDKFNMIGSALPNGANPTVHLSITDRSGDNAIFEYIKGKLIVHHNKKYQVMTNEPSYEKQLTLNNYWKEFHGVFLPGTIIPEDRFVRASYFLNNAEKTSDQQKAVAIVFSIIRNVSVPMVITDSGKPNVAVTLWRCAANLKENIYFFENTDRPNIFWVDVKKMNLTVGAPVKKLSLQHGQIYAAEVSDKFVPSKSFFKNDKS